MQRNFILQNQTAANSDAVQLLYAIERIGQKEHH